MNFAQLIDPERALDMSNRRDAKLPTGTLRTHVAGDTAKAPRETTMGPLKQAIIDILIETPGLKIAAIKGALPDHSEDAVTTAVSQLKAWGALRTEGARNDWSYFAG